MRALNDPTTALLRALRHSLADAPGYEVEEISSRSWASGTFVGTRHALAFRLAGEGADAAADAFLADLEEAEFQLRGHILADIALVSRYRTNGADGPIVRIAVEALTVEDS